MYLQPALYHVLPDYARVRPDQPGCSQTGAWRLQPIIREAVNAVSTLSGLCGSRPGSAWHLPPCDDSPRKPHSRLLLKKQNTCAIIEHCTPLFRLPSYPNRKEEGESMSDQSRSPDELARVVLEGVGASALGCLKKAEMWGVRRQIVPIIHQAGDKDAEAADHIEQSLRSEVSP